jgi:NAD-dependent deacetylase
MTVDNGEFDRIVGDIAKVAKTARRLGFLTGAGISAESGLPTYRGIGGLYNEMTVDEGLPIEEVLSGPMFQRTPAVTWKYLAEIEHACRGGLPNEAHRIIAALERRFEVCVITQNVDGFHRMAGSTNVIELHGNLAELFCTACGARSTEPDFSKLRIPPRCHACGAIQRPDVVLFGELLPTAAVARYQQQLDQGFDMLFAIGTNAIFPYIHEPVMDAPRLGCVTVEINPDETVLSSAVSYRLATGAVHALRAIQQELTVGRAH